MTFEARVACSNCKVNKPAIDFVVDRSKKSGHTSQCKTCRYPHSKEWKKQNCERQNLAQRRYRKRAISNHREVKQDSQWDSSGWEVFDNQRALREMNALGDGFRLVPKDETHTSVLMTPHIHSFEEMEGIFDGFIADGAVVQDDPVELFLVYVVLKLYALGIWVNFFILTS